MVAVSVAEWSQFKVTVALASTETLDTETLAFFDGQFLSVAEVGVTPSAYSSSIIQLN